MSAAPYIEQVISEVLFSPVEPQTGTHDTSTSKGDSAALEDNTGEGFVKAVDSKGMQAKSGVSLWYRAQQIYEKQFKTLVDNGDKQEALRVAELVHDKVAGACDSDVQFHNKQGSGIINQALAVWHSVCAVGKWLSSPAVVNDPDVSAATIGALVCCVPPKEAQVASFSCVLRQFRSVTFAAWLTGVWLHRWMNPSRKQLALMHEASQR